MEIETPTLRRVAVHSGSGRISGKARQWAYHTASLFTAKRTRDGRLIWTNAGVGTYPRRSLARAEADAVGLALEQGATLEHGRGSLHNTPVREDQYGPAYGTPTAAQEDEADIVRAGVESGELARYTRGHGRPPTKEMTTMDIITRADAWRAFARTTARNFPGDGNRGLRARIKRTALKGGSVGLLGGRIAFTAGGLASLDECAAASARWQAIAMSEDPTVFDGN